MCGVNEAFSRTLGTTRMHRLRVALSNEKTADVAHALVLHIKESILERETLPAMVHDVITLTEKGTGEDSQLTTQCVP